MLKYKTKFGGRHFPPGHYNNVKICKAETDSKGNLVVTLDYTNAKPVDPAWAESYGDLYAKRHPAANRSSDLYELNKAAWPQVNLSNFATPPPVMTGAPGRRCATEVRAHLNAMEAAKAFDSTWMGMMKALHATVKPISHGSHARPTRFQDYAIKSVKMEGITTAKIANSADSGLAPPADYPQANRFVGPGAWTAVRRPEPGLWSRVWRAINRFAFRDS